MDKFKHMSHFRNIFLYGLVLILLGAFRISLFSQQNSRQTIRALESIRLHYTEKPRVKISNPIKQFRYRKLDDRTIKAIENEMIKQLHQEGYYLSRVDSTTTQVLSGETKAVLNIYLDPGPRFMLIRVNWDLTDSLKSQFQEPVPDVVRDYLGKPYTENSQKQMFQRILTVFENNGYPLCRIETTGFNLDSLDHEPKGFVLNIRILPEDEINLTGLKLPPKTDISTRFLERTFGFKSGEIYRKTRIERYERLLSKQDFIKSTTAPQVVVENDSLYFLKLNFEENPSTAFDGVIGYIPPPVNQPEINGYFTGLFNIGLRNLFGTGRKMDVFWQKPDRYSEEFRVKYREPFVFGLPFHAGVELHRLIRDTTYIEWEYALNGEIPLNENLTGLARFYTRQVYPDSLASAIQRFPQTKAVHTVIGFDWDTRNRLYNPTSGFLLSTLFDYGTQRNIGPAYLIQEDSLVQKTNVTRLTSRLAIFLQFFKRQVLALDFHAVLIGYQGQKVQIPDMFWFGGATTVRGYRENQFYGDRVTWLNTEYRFLVGPRSRFFVFTDGAYYSRKVPQFKEEYLLGYGLGFRFPGPLGDLQVDYGLARGTSFSEGKIHFRLINNF